MPIIVKVVVGNLSPSYEFTLKRDSAVINLTGAISVVMNIKNAQTGAVTGTGLALVITGLSTGKVLYSPLAAHFPSEGRYWGEVKITHSGSLPETLYKYVDFVAREDFV